MKRLDKANNDPYIGSIVVRGHQCDFYLNDYGQCYYFQYLDENNNVEVIGCGTYNEQFIEVALGTFDNKGLCYSIGDIDYWNDVQKLRAERGLKSIDYDDYQIYNIKSMYDNLQIAE